MRTAITIAISLALTAGLVSGNLSAANATAACVSKAEYKKIKTGMTRAEVKTLTGTGGKKFSAYEIGDGVLWMKRSYKMCNSSKRAYVDYMDGVVSGKSKM